MFFDTKIQISDLEIAIGEGFVEVSIDLAMSLPAGPSTIIPLNVGTLRFGLTKEGAIEAGEKLIETGNSIEEEPKKTPSDLLIVPSMAGVDEAVKQADKLREG